MFVKAARFQKECMCLSRLPGFKRNACQGCQVSKGMTNLDESHYSMMKCLHTSICRGLQCSNQTWAIYTVLAASIVQTAKGCKMFNHVFIVMCKNITKLLF